MDWIQVAQNVGVSFACLAALAWAVWRALRWLGVTILQPLVTRHMTFLDRVATSVEAMTGSMREISEASNGEAAQRRETAEKMDGILSKLDVLLSGVGEVRGNVKQLVIHAETAVFPPAQRGSSPS